MIENPYSAQTVQTDEDFRKTQTIFDLIFPRPRNFSVRLWNHTTIEADQPRQFTIVLKHPSALRKMFRPPIELSMGEGFINDDFDIEGDLLVALTLFDRLQDHSLSLIPQLLRLWLSLPAENQPAVTKALSQAQLTGKIHSKERDQAAIHHHYDVSNDFYALWLDKRMVYSCANFPTGTEDLDTAQERKLAICCRKLDLRPGEKVLDIGCGWGGFANYAAEHYGVDVLGITLSEQQYKFANQHRHQSGKARFELADYRDINYQQFDKIVSIGMVEHVGRDHLGEYFARVYQLLKPGGLFLNHGIAKRAGNHSLSERLLYRKVIGYGSFMNRHIFPDGELVPVSEMNIHAEDAGFEVIHLENWRKHYANTLRHWVKRLEQHQDEAIKLTDEVTYRTWRLYMTACIYGFERHNLTVNQTLLQKAGAK